MNKRINYEKVPKRVCLICGSPIEFEYQLRRLHELAWAPVCSYKCHFEHNRRLRKIKMSKSDELGAARAAFRRLKRLVKEMYG